MLLLFRHVQQLSGFLSPGSQTPPFTTFQVRLPTPLTAPPVHTDLKQPWWLFKITTLQVYVLEKKQESDLNGFPAAG